jgi:hypothetical protein
MKIQSDPHGDMRSQAEMTWPRHSKPVYDGVTEVPKVNGKTPGRQGLLPLSWVTTRCAVGYMLENPVYLLATRSPCHL